MNQHFAEKVSTAKFKVNFVWKEFISNECVSLKNKLDLFNSVGRTTVCYASEEWGLRKIDSINILQKMFTKKVLKLPPNTPNYVLTVECGLQDMFIHTLGRHLNYIYKVLFLYDLDRLAHKLAVMGIDNSNDWWLEWDNYGKQFNLDWNNRDSHIWKNNIQTILSRVKEGIFNDSLSSARNCSTVFNSLSYLNGNGFFKLNLRVEVVSLLLKIRSTLIPLNDKPWRSVERRICSLCNRNEIENVEHFQSFQNLEYFTLACQILINITQLIMAT